MSVLMSVDTSEWKQNFNRLSSLGHHGLKRCELSQRAHSHWSHAFTHTLTSTQLQPRVVKHQLSYYFSVHAWSFPVSVIHQALTWTTGSLSSLRDYSCACIYTQGLGTLTANQHNIFDSETLTNLSCAPGEIRTSVLWISSLTIYQLNHPVTGCVFPSVCLCKCLSVRVSVDFFSYLYSDVPLGHSKSLEI